MTDRLGNREPSRDVYPDRPAPVVRNMAEGRELAWLTWGMPTPPQFLKTKDAPDTGVTNIRNTASPHWRRWLGAENRCLVPVTAFSEYGSKLDLNRKMARTTGYAEWFQETQQGRGLDGT